MSITLDDPRMTPFRERLAAWLASRGVEAVLVRPDRYIFGAGAPDRRTRAGARALDGASS